LLPKLFNYETSNSQIGTGNHKKSHRSHQAVKGIECTGFGRKSDSTLIAKINEYNTLIIAFQQTFTEEIILKYQGCDLLFFTSFRRLWFYIEKRRQLEGLLLQAMEPTKSVCGKEFIRLDPTTNK
jgi:hypothetical protein